MSFGIKVIESLAIDDVWFGKPLPYDVGSAVAEPDGFFDG
jgi:hypothetical protein